MTAPANRIATIVVSIACLVTGTVWWWLRLDRINIERDLALVVGENQKNAIEAGHDGSKRGNPRDAKRSETRMSGVPSWQEPLSALCKQLSDRRTANPRPHFVRPPSGPGGGLFKELMDNPEYARLAALIMRSGTQAKLLGTFRWAGIPTEKQAKLLDLILEMGFAHDDAEIAVKKYGVAAPEAEQVGWSTGTEVDHEIQELLGGEIYDRWKQAEQARGARDLIEGFETRLSYSTTLMTETQRQQLFGLLVKAKVGFMIQPGQLDPVIEAAHGFLSNDQVVILKQVGDEYNLGKRIE